jgi:hypothetical protein
MILRALTAFEIRWATAALSAFFPDAPRGALPIGVASLDVGAYLRDIFARVPFEPVMGLRLAIWIAGLAPIFVLHRARTIASLDARDRERVVGALVTSPVYAVRQLLVALKAIGALLYCGQPEVRDAMLAPRTDPSLVRLRAHALPSVASEPAARTAALTAAPSAAPSVEGVTP